MSNLDTEAIKLRLGIQSNGRIQNILDNSVIHHLRLKEPGTDGSQIQRNTVQAKPGLVQVQVAFAQYLNRGLLYVDPKTRKGAFYSPSYGFWSRPGTEKLQTNTPLNYSGGSQRGAHFVERTITEDISNILEDIREGMKHDN